MEASACNGGDECECAAPPLTLPIHEYSHGGTPFRFSVTGGEVYRGCAIPQLWGVCFFTDFCNDQIWSFRVDGAVVDLRDWTAALAPGGGFDIRSISSFGRDASGELYVCDLDDGEVFKIVLATPPLPVVVVTSDPPNGAIDARQPSEPDGTRPAGWRVIQMMFDGPAPCLSLTDFYVAQTGGTLPAPSVVAVEAVSARAAHIWLSGPIEVRAWTTMAHVASGTGVRVGWFPGDVNADGTSNPKNPLALLDALNGVVSPLPIWSMDVDRSGAAAPVDVLRVIDLLGGANTYERHLHATLP